MKTNLLVLPVVLFAFTACHREGEHTPSPQPKVSGNVVTFEANAPELASLPAVPAQPSSSSITRLNGRITWDDDVTVRVFSPFAGRVISVEADLGAKVEKDTVLAWIGSPDFGQVQADARKADADAAQMERNAARLRELFDHGAAAAKDVASAESDLVRAKAEASRTRTRLALYNATSDSIDNRYSLRSQVHGNVVERYISAGQEVRSDQILANNDRNASPLFVVTDPTRLWVVMDVTEQELHKLHVGSMVTVHRAVNPDVGFPAKVEVIADALDPVSRTARVRASVANPDRQLKGEMLVSVDVDVAVTQAVLVPSKSVFFLGENHYIFARTGPCRFERREVSTGSERDGWSQITKGVASGDEIVADGALLLQQVLEQGAELPPQTLAKAPPGPGGSVVTR